VKVINAVKHCRSNGHTESVLHSLRERSYVGPRSAL
jgi:hypothetical protein